MLSTWPEVIVLTEAYVSHGFQFRVNRKPAHYFRVNSAFRGILVPGAGDYTVSFVTGPASSPFCWWWRDRNCAAWVLAGDALEELTCASYPYLEQTFDHSAAGNRTDTGRSQGENKLFAQLQAFGQRRSRLSLASLV